MEGFFRPRLQGLHLGGQNLVHDHPDHLHPVLLKQGQIQTHLIHRTPHAPGGHNHHLAAQQLRHLGIRQIQHAPYPGMARPLDQHKIVLPSHPVEGRDDRLFHRRQIPLLQVIPGEHPVHRDRRHRLDGQIHPVGVAHQDRILVDLFTGHLDKPLSHRLGVTDLGKAGTQRGIETHAAGGFAVILACRRHVNPRRDQIEFHPGYLPRATAGETGSG